MHVPLRHRRPRRLALITALAIAIAAAVAIPVIANLTGSSFESGDGNLVVDTSGNLDWANAPNFAKTIDKPTGSTDDSFGQGTKEDTPVPSVVAGSIPNNKSDLTRFYFANDKPSTDQFVYFAWERVQDPNGTTNMDIELNQSNVLSSNGVTPVRTAGDVLFKYDLSQGGTHPNLGYHRWITSGPGSQCEANNTTPCWDKVHQLDNVDFEASINTSSVLDPIAPNNPRTLDIRTFGEAAVNLTHSGILPAGTCAGFASAYLKSRSSDSFTAAVKDFVAPLNAGLGTCPVTVKLKKVDQNNNPMDGATMQLFRDNPNAGTQGVLDNNDTEIAPDTTPSPCSTTHNPVDGIGNCIFTLAGVPATNGQYIAHELTAPPGYNKAGDQVFTVTVSNSAQTITKTFTDNPAPGRINIHKQDDAGNALEGVVFTLHPDLTPFGPPDGNGTNQDQHGNEDVASNMTCTTDAGGDCSITSVPIGKYWVVETSGLPSGYDSAPDQYADVGLGSTSETGVTINLTFVDPRQHKVIIVTCHEGTNTAVASTVKHGGTDAKTTATGTAANTLCASSTAAQYGGLKHSGGTPETFTVDIPGNANGTH